jgi:hypothetical protein
MFQKIHKTYWKMELQINFLEEIILDLFLNLYLVLQNLEILLYLFNTTLVLI